MIKTAKAQERIVQTQMKNIRNAIAAASNEFDGAASNIGATRDARAQADDAIASMCAKMSAALKTTKLKPQELEKEMQKRKKAEEDLEKAAKTAKDMAKTCADIATHDKQQRIQSATLAAQADKDRNDGETLAHSCSELEQQIKQQRVHLHSVEEKLNVRQRAQHELNVAMQAEDKRREIFEQAEASLHAAKAAHPAFVANCDAATAETTTLTEQHSVRKARVDELSKLIQRATAALAELNSVSAAEDMDDDSTDMASMLEKEVHVLQSNADTLRSSPETSLLPGVA